MAKKTIYIAGRVKGLPFDQVEAIFAKREKELKREGYKVINPVKKMQAHNQQLNLEDKYILSDDCDEDRKQIIRLSIKWMMEADEIDLLFNWKESEFAQKERNVAAEIGMPINYPK